MKKLQIVAVLFAFITSNLFAQTLMEKPKRSVPNKIINQVPSVPAPAPSPTMKTTAPVTEVNSTIAAATAAPASVYSLTSARVNIKTGTDNKEFPSTVLVWVVSKGVGHALEQPAENLRNEMKSNSNTEFGLQNYSDRVAGFNNPVSKLLTSFQKEGLILTIRYLPNLLTDAWKIEGVTLTLEFKDQFGNLHPQYGNKAIIFNNANGFLNTWEKDMVCTADSNFNPLTSSIKK